MNTFAIKAAPWLLALVIGVALGWLSVWSQAFTSTIMTTALATLAGVGSAATYVHLALRVAPKIDVNPGTASTVALPVIAAIAVGLIIGVVGGQKTKDLTLLGQPSLSAMTEYWKPTQLRPCEIARAVFAKQYALPTQAAACSMGNRP